MKGKIFLPLNKINPSSIRHGIPFFPRFLVVQTYLEENDIEYSIIDHQKHEVLYTRNVPEHPTDLDEIKSFWIVGPNLMVFLDQTDLALYDMEKDKIIATEDDLYEMTDSLTFHSWKQKLFMYTYTHSNGECHLGIYDPIQQKMSRYLYLEDYFIASGREIEISDAFEDEVICIVGCERDRFITGTSLYFVDLLTMESRIIYLNTHDEITVDFVKTKGGQQAIAVYCKHNENFMFAITLDGTKLPSGWTQETDKIFECRDNRSTMKPV